MHAHICTEHLVHHLEHTKYFFGGGVDTCQALYTKDTRRKIKSYSHGAHRLEERTNVN